MGKEKKQRKQNSEDDYEQDAKRFSILYEEDPNSPVHIELDRPTPHYIPGETITGKVNLYLTKQIEVKEISLQFLGTARTSWAIVQDKRKIGDNYYVSSETYLDETIKILQASTPTTISAGTYDYPFSLKLPSTLPSTFIDGHGCITYVIKAFVKLRQDELTGMAALIIDGVYDLNLEPELNQRAELYAKRKSGCPCNRGGLIEMLVKFPKRGYISGDLIKWEGLFTNQSRKRVKRVIATLIQRTEFHAEGYSIVDSKVISKAIAGAIKEKDKETWNGAFAVPMLPPSRLGGSKLINLQYFVEFKMRISGCIKNLKAEIPITIGTIPLKRHQGDAEINVTSRFGHKPSKHAKNENSTAKL